MILTHKDENENELQISRNFHGRFEISVSSWEKISGDMRPKKNTSTIEISYEDISAITRFLRS